jgi:hypothetical protein
MGMYVWAKDKLDQIKLIYYGYFCIKECREIKKLINLPRKGLINSLVIKTLAFLLLFAKKSAGNHLSQEHLEG